MVYTCLCPVLENMDEEARRLVAINSQNQVCVGRLECPLHFRINGPHPEESYSQDWYE